MQHDVRARRALDDSCVEGAVVAVAMQLDRDFAIIVLQGFKLSIHAAQPACNTRRGNISTPFESNFHYVLWRESPLFQQRKERIQRGGLAKLGDDGNLGYQERLELAASSCGFP